MERTTLPEQSASQTETVLEGDITDSGSQVRIVSLYVILLIMPVTCYSVKNKNQKFLYY